MPFRVNRLSSLPRGLGTLSALEILDLTYNNLNEKSLPGNFFIMRKNALEMFNNQCHILLFKSVQSDSFCFIPLDQLRGLYLGDNDFEALPGEIGQLTSLQVVSSDFDSKYWFKESRFRTKH